MPSLLNKPWVVAGLGLAAVALSARALLPDTAAAASALLAPEVSETIANLEREEDGLPSRALIAQILRTVAPPAEGLRDPFVPTVDPEQSMAAAATAPGETVRLSAVWLQGSVAYSVVNGRIVQAGEVIGSLTVDHITRDGIWLTHARGRQFVAVGQDYTWHRRPIPSADSAAVALSHEG